MLLLLWDAYLIENDVYFIFFICLALLDINKSKILGTDSSLVPQTLTTLSIDKPEELTRLLKT